MPDKNKDPLENLDMQFSVREIVTAAGQVAVLEKMTQDETIAFGRGITHILAWAQEIKDQKKKTKKVKLILKV